MRATLALTVVVFGVSVSSIYGAHERNVRLTGVESPPYGPFYCQARCLASCIEMNLAPSLEACTKFCPPFDAAMPCPPNNLDCWRNCGVPPSPRDKHPPPTVNFIMAQHTASADQRVQDPFTIELTWDPVPSASVYIVEMYPLNRQPRPGENNFFRALTSFPTYMVRKEDECTIYDVRVLPVNAFGVGAPQYTRIEAPRPTMTGPENFYVRAIRRDPTNENFVVVTIDYALMAMWPVQDVDLVGLRVKAVQCKGMAPQTNGTANFGMQTDNAWYPFYDILIGKTPTPAIQLAFLDEVVKSDCLFQMRVSALTSRCNTTTYFDSNGGATQDSAVGVDFHINCLTAAGFSCADDQHQSPFVALPNPGPAVPPAEPRSMPIPPPVPSFVTSGNASITAPIMPPGAATGIQMPQSPVVEPSGNGLAINPGSINENTHPLLIDYLAINSQPIPANCDIDTLDVQPTPSTLGPSLVDLAVSWSEKNPGTRRSASYFIVRYGPIVRTLVEDSRRPQRIVAGQETIVRTGTSSTSFTRGSPERRVKVTGVPKGSLLSFQICAVYDANIEHLISWDVARSQHVDLLALQPSSESNVHNAPSKGAITSLAPLATDESPLSAAPADSALVPDSNSIAAAQAFNGDTNNALGKDSGENVDETAPIIVQVGIIDARPSSTTFWLVLIGGVLLTLLTGVMVLMFILRLWSKRATAEKEVKVNPFPQVPIAVITKMHQPQTQKEKEALEVKEVEKVALP